MVDLGQLRGSVILRGVRRLEPDGPVHSRPEPPLRGAEAATTGLPTENGEQPPQKPGKQEDHYGFMFSMSEADLH